jgi:hypothetical protein
VSPPDFARWAFVALQFAAPPLLRQGRDRGRSTFPLPRHQDAA